MYGMWSINDDEDHKLCEFQTLILIKLILMMSKIKFIRNWFAIEYGWKPNH